MIIGVTKFLLVLVLVLGLGLSFSIWLIILCMDFSQSSIDSWYSWYGSLWSIHTLPTNPRCPLINNNSANKFVVSGSIVVKYDAHVVPFSKVLCIIWL